MKRITTTINVIDRVKESDKAVECKNDFEDIYARLHPGTETFI